MVLWLYKSLLQTVKKSSFRIKVSSHINDKCEILYEFTCSMIYGSLQTNSQLIIIEIQELSSRIICKATETSCLKFFRHLHICFMYIVYEIFTL